MGWDEPHGLKFKVVSERTDGSDEREDVCACLSALGDAFDSSEGPVLNETRRGEGSLAGGWRVEAWLGRLDIVNGLGSGEGALIGRARNTWRWCGNRRPRKFKGIQLARSSQEVLGEGVSATL